MYHITIYYSTVVPYTIITPCVEIYFGTKVDVMSGRHTVPFWVKSQNLSNLVSFFSPTVQMDKGGGRHSGWRGGTRDDRRYERRDDSRSRERDRARGRGSLPPPEPIHPPSSWRRPAMPPPRMHGGPSYPRTSEKAEHSFSYSPLPGVGKGQSRGMERRESTPGLEVTVVIVVGLW